MVTGVRNGTRLTVGKRLSGKVGFHERYERIRLTIAARKRVLLSGQSVTFHGSWWFNLSIFYIRFENE